MLEFMSVKGGCVDLASPSFGRLQRWKSSRDVIAKVHKHVCMYVYTCVCADISTRKWVSVDISVYVCAVWVYAHIHM